MMRKYAPKIRDASGPGELMENKRGVQSENVNQSALRKAYFHSTTQELYLSSSTVRHASSNDTGNSIFLLITCIPELKASYRMIP